MGIYYKLMSEKHYKSIPNLHDSYITVASLKRKIVESIYCKTKNRNNTYNVNETGQCVGCDFSISLINAQTLEEYIGNDTLVPNNTSVLVRRLPGDRRRSRLDTTPIVVVVQSNSSADADVVVESDSCVVSCSGAGSGSVESGEWDDDFGGDVYVQSVESAVSGLVSVSDAGTGLIVKVENSDRLNALGGSGSRYVGGSHGKVPPLGYVCHRCNIPGHFIKDCLTNGDPDYNLKRVRKPKGIPKSMLEVDLNGRYVLESGESAVLKVNEEAFDREMESLSSSMRTSSTCSKIPPELHCPLCKQVIKDAVLTSKCCFETFCDKCIRDHMISTGKCVCRDSNVLNDDLIPNVTVRDAITRILYRSCSSSSSGTNATGHSSVSTLENQSTMPALPSIQKLKLPVATQENLNAGDTTRKRQPDSLPSPAAKKVKPAMVSREASTGTSEVLFAEKDRISGDATRKRKMRASQDEEETKGYMTPPPTGPQGSYPFWGGNGMMYYYGYGGPFPSMNTMGYMMPTGPFRMGSR